MLRRVFLAALCASGAANARSARSGRWSSPSTWIGGRVPAEGSVVDIDTAHRVEFDQSSPIAHRGVHIAGTLAFSRRVSTQLNAGSIEIARGGVLEVGTFENPIPSGINARIRLTWFDGFDPESLPALVCNGGRMDLHGVPMSRTWLKLARPVLSGESSIPLAEQVTGWRAGDRILITGTTRQHKPSRTFRKSVRDDTQTEERRISSINGSVISLDRPLRFRHGLDGQHRAEAANLSRNVIVESADPSKPRGHTMYHRGSRGSISYTEFRELGKPGVLGRYSLHFHECRDSMRGASVIGASIWNSGNRWITVHGTDYLLVRDCVGYNSLGHGFFLEDGTESYNIFDRNLAVQALTAPPLPNQVLTYDHNDGAGFWWANSNNAFVNNVACECDEYGYRFDVVASPRFDPVLAVPQRDGSTRRTDIRTLPFVLFENNEAHCQRRWAVNLGGFSGDLQTSVDGIGPDTRHPFRLRSTRVWNSHWGFHTQSPNVMLDGYSMHVGDYAHWRQNFTGHAYRNVVISAIDAPPVSETRKGAPPIEADFPKPLDPIDDQPPLVIVTSAADGRIQGAAVDEGGIKNLTCNGKPVQSKRSQYLEWEAIVPRATKEIVIAAEDKAGNRTSERYSLPDLQRLG